MEKPRVYDSMPETEILVRVAVMETEIQASRRAMELQAHEYERRLMELNHAHEQQMARNSEYVRRESWEIYTSDWNKWRLEVDKWHWVAMGIAISLGTIAGAIMQWLLRR